MEMMISLVTLVGMGYAAFRGLKWMFRSGQVQTRRDDPLTPRDLKVLEEAAARLMVDLRATTDECVARIESVMEKAEARLSANECGEPREAEQCVALTGEVQLLANLEKLRLTSPSPSSTPYLNTIEELSRP